ncbi:MAG: zinc ribbon domain-containing protein [Clostridia bacterium]|nr:zinc ribbon domain-containing protein [Clostridia bacterium]
MGLFEETVVKAKDAFDVAAKKTNEVISIQKLKISAARVESQISKDYEILGRMFFDEKANDEELSESYKTVIEGIKDSREELEAIKAQIDEQKRTKKCTKCGAKNSDTSKYCGECGEKL